MDEARLTSFVPSREDLRLLSDEECMCSRTISIPRACMDYFEVATCELARDINASVAEE